MSQYNFHDERESEIERGKERKVLIDRFSTVILNGCNH